MTHSPSSAQSDLAPCPFCGGDAHIETRDVEPQGVPWYGDRTETFVLCECGACLFDGSFHEGFYDPETRAVAAWNKRMAPSFPYQKTFNAISAATKIEASGHISISVKAFVEEFGEAEARAAASAEDKP